MAKKRDWPTLRDLLEAVREAIIEDMMKLANVKSQAELAKALKIDANTISRYKRGIHVPVNNIVMLYGNLGLTPAQTAWRIGRILQEQYPAGRVSPDSRPAEVREPQARYDERSVERALAEIEAYDFGVLEAEKTFAFNRERGVLRDMSGELLADDKAAGESFERRRRALLQSISLFKERARKELHLAREQGR